MNQLNKELKEIIKSVKTYIELEREAGVKDVLLDTAPEVMEAEKSKNSFEDFELECLSCKKCQLHKTLCPLNSTQLKPHL